MVRKLYSDDDILNFLRQIELELAAGSDASASPKTARKVADYVAGMTDRFALDEHSRLFDPCGEAVIPGPIGSLSARGGIHAAY